MVRQGGTRKNLTNLAKLREHVPKIKPEAKAADIMNSLKSITIFDHLQSNPIEDLFDIKERRFAYEAQEDSDGEVPRLNRHSSLPYGANIRMAAESHQI